MVKKRARVARPGAPPIPTPAPTLVPGREVPGFEVPAPLVDVRGWPVVGPEGTTLGVVDRIMVDVVERQPRYLSIHLGGRTGYFLLPVGLARLDVARRTVRLDALDARALEAMPLLTDATVTEDVERKVMKALTGKLDVTTAPAQHYGESMFDRRAMAGDTPAGDT